MPAKKSASKTESKSSGKKKSSKKTTKKSTASSSDGGGSSKRRDDNEQRQGEEEQDRQDSESSTSESGQDEGSKDEGSKDGGGKLKPMEAARLAVQQIRQLTGRTVDGVSGVERSGDGWHVLVEVVEVERVPRATDVIGVYEAELDSEGDLDSYERVRRYVRGQAGDDS